MLDKLQSVGLGQKESLVYYALLGLGKGTADQIAKSSGVKRSTTYVQLETLMNFGLVSSIEEGKKRFFIAESPEKLGLLLNSRESSIHNQRQALDQILPGLNDLYYKIEDKPRVRFFEGKEGVSAIRYEMADCQDKEALIIVSLPGLRSTYSNPERTDFSKMRIKKGVKIKSLFIDDGSEKYRDMKNTDAKELPQNITEKFDIKSDVYIFDSKVALVSTGENPNGVIIENQSINQSHRMLFELIWNSLK